MPVRIFGPGIEFPVRDSDLGAVAGCPLHKDRSKVTRPDSVGRERKEIDLVEVDPGSPQHSLDTIVSGAVLSQDADALGAMQVTHNLDVDPGNR